MCVLSASVLWLLSSMILQHDKHFASQVETGMDVSGRPAVISDNGDFGTNGDASKCQQRLGKKREQPSVSGACQLHAQKVGNHFSLCRPP